MKRWLWLAVIPGALTLGLVFYLRIRYTRLPVVSFDIDIASTILVPGLLITGLTVIIVYLVSRIENARIEAREMAAEDRRSFLRRLDHELKNPITAIFMGTANLKIAQSPGQNRANIENIEVHTRRLQILTSDLRKLADLERKPIEQAPVDVATLLQETFDITTDIHQDKEREFRLTLPSVPWPLPYVRGDRDLLQLAFHNLLDNAVKFSDNQDSIELRAFEDGSFVTIEVADSGRGISSQDLPYIWEELYRGDLARGIPGSGLGLALTKAIIERHGGSISARSRVGDGTVVSVSLPLS